MKKMPVRRTGAYRRKKALVVANMVANVIANEPITHNATAFHDPVSRYFIE